MVSLARLVLKRLRTRLNELFINPLLTSRALLYNPYLAGKYVPLQQLGQYVVMPDERGSSADPIALPPIQLWEGYGSSGEGYLASGRQDVQTMLDILRQEGASETSFSTVLDFGCAAGRMARFFPRQSGAELWGVDIESEHIMWCQQHLQPGLNFATTTTAPHLPFEDGYFDLVYSASVFTHITDLADAWLLELRRVLRPGGHAYITIHDRTSIELLFSTYRHRSDCDFLRELLQDLDARTSVLSSKYAYFAIGREPGVQVFYDREYVVSRWSAVMDVRSVREQAHDYQAAIVLRKTRPKSSRSDTPDSPDRFRPRVPE